MLEILGDLAIPCIICFLVGVVLCIIEMFTPGFGVSGVLGMACFFAVFVMQFVGNDFLGALIVSAVVIVVMVAVLIIFVRSFQSGRLSRSKIVLQDNIDSSSTVLDEQDFKDLVGKEGTTITPLRPAGIASIDDRRVDVQTYGNFIEANQKVTVVAVENLRIIVK